MGPKRLPLAGPATAAALLLALSASCHRAPDGVPPGVDAPSAVPSKLDTGRLGTLHLQSPRDGAKAFVLLFSTGDRWSAGDDTVAATLASEGAIVAGVDLAPYREALDGSDGDCLYLLSEVESLSQQVQRLLGVTPYRTPLVAGSGEAATLAMAMLAQAPAATLAGAVAVDPRPALRTRLPLCAGASSRRVGDGFAYDAAGPLPGFLFLGFTATADTGGRKQAMEGFGHEATLRDASRDQAPPTPDRLLGELLSSRIRVATADDNGIPGWIIEQRAASPVHRLAVVLSGDGGWRDLDKTVASALQQRGVNVIGWDSLRYFWTEKTPEQLAADLDAQIRRAVRDWSVDDVALVGYSFGADVLPFAYNRLPADTRSLVKQVSLLALSPSADFEFHVSGWLGAKSGEAKATAPELQRIPSGLLQCFYGEDEEDAACPAQTGRGVEVIRTSGGHHFDGDYDALATRILEGLERRRGGSPDAR